VGLAFTAFIAMKWRAAMWGRRAVTA